MSEQVLDEEVLVERPLQARGRQSRVAFVVALVLAVLLLVFALRGVSWVELWAAVRRGDVRGVILAVVLVSVSYFVRGLRWRVLIEAESPISVGAAFWMTMVGYLGNSFLPARRH